MSNVATLLTSSGSAAAVLADLGDDVLRFLSVASIGDHDIRAGLRDSDGRVTSKAAAAARDDCDALLCGHGSFLLNECSQASGAGVPHKPGRCDHSVQFR